ncbi:MAG TPA: ABC transporter substrate-binding protein, partial [Jatrophihabitans sp.]|nr:ABC transporter substrate-binding protein [Jatrophihabitans sp.]
ANGAGGTAVNDAGGPVAGAPGVNYNGAGSLGGGTGGSGGSGGTGGTKGGGGSGGRGGSAGSGGSGGGSGGSATGGIRAGSCAGFKNGTGITSSTITIANVADLSGPVPGLFKSAQAAVTAYVAYFNSTSSICGRKLKLVGLDSGTSESGDQQASQTACGSAFAMVGSMGAFDAGGASTVTQCGIPDIRAASTETARQKAPVTFGAYSLATSEIPTSPFTYFKSLGGAYKNAAFVYLNAGASSLNADSFIAGEKKMGFNFKDKIAIDVTSVPNYNGYATQLKSDGIQYVQYIGAFQYAQKLKEAMYQQGYNPIFVMDPTAYDANYVAAGKPVDRTYVFIAGPLFEEANRNPQLAAYINWLNRTSGGVPTFFGTYAWTAAALFTQIAVQLGGKLTRSAMVAALQQVHGYTDQNMTPAMDVGGKHTPKCLSVIQLQNGHWVRKTPYPYTCGSYVNSGVGG